MRAHWWWVLRCTLALIVPSYASGASAPSEQALDRTLIVSLRAREAPNAVAEVRAQVSNRSGPLYQLLGAPLTAKRLLYREPTPSELKIAELNPEAPEALIASFIEVTYAPGQRLDVLESRVKGDSRVRSVERAWKSNFSSPPVDTYFVSSATPPERQWGMQARTISNPGGMNFATAWELIRGSAYLNVVDDGIETSGGSFRGSTHPDLAANFRPQFSINTGNRLRFNGVDERFLTDGIGPTGGSYGHGTHVAGIMAARSSKSDTAEVASSEGVAGGCFNCSLMVTKFGEHYSLFNDIVFATDMGAQVINRSGGIGFFHQNCDTAVSICAALDRARNRGVVFVAASGNDGNVAAAAAGFPDDGVDFPARATRTGDGTPLAIAVGGIKADGGRWTASYGANGSNWGPQQVVVAPAKDVISTTYRTQDWNPSCADGLNSATGLETLAEGYGDCTGTSMAAPHVSALAGLLKSADPLLNAAEVREAIQASGDRWPNWNTELAYGVPDAGKAVQTVLNGYRTANPVPSNRALKNRLTPLFSLYSRDARNHFYTIFPQMAASALDGTLRPRPRARVVVPTTGTNSWAACCSQDLNDTACSTHPPPGGDPRCGVMQVPIPAGTLVLGPDNSPVGGVRVAIFGNPSDPDHATPPFGVDVLNNVDAPSPVTDRFGTVVSSRSLGSVGSITATNLIFGATSAATVYALPLDDVPLYYSVLDKDTLLDASWRPAIARKVPEFTHYPSYYYCVPYEGGRPVSCPPSPYPTPTAAVRVFTGHTNPSGGPDLVPLYRLSFKCGDYPDPACSTYPLHVSHFYATDRSEVFGQLAFTTVGYQLDGIEGYVYSKDSPQPAGTVKLCRAYSTDRDDWVLFPGTGVGGQDCSAWDFEGGVYNNYATFIGYVYSVTSDTTAASRAHANVQTGLYRPSTASFYLDFDLNAGVVERVVPMGNVGDKGLVGDFDGDGRADLVVFQTSAGYGSWVIDPQRQGGLCGTCSVYFFGGSGDVPLLGDFDGDGTADLVLFRNGAWYVHTDHTDHYGSVQYAFTFGTAGDVPFVGDFDGDGRADIGVFRQGTWLISLSSGTLYGSTIADLTVGFGAPTDVPFVADWDRDGIADLGLFRDGIWYVSTRRDSFAQVVYGMGGTGDTPLAARFNQ